MTLINRDSINTFFHPGWNKLFNEMCNELDSVKYINIGILEAKEKHGTLQTDYYIEANSYDSETGGLRSLLLGEEEARNIVSKYEKLSKNTCERCGSIENVKTIAITQFGFLATRCCECYVEHFI